MNQVGRYQILEELGRGAMGVVYKALDPAIGRTVAIKTIRLSDLSNPDERQRVQERLLREAQSAGVLSHPNIVTIYDVLEKEDYAYIFMEYVNGSSLERMLRKQALPESSALLHFLRQVAEALDYAHRKGIIHRDIKPANIIISEGGPGVERLAKIADFGVAKFVSHEMTHSGTMIGTPNYMSPEQIEGVPIDRRSDQFSLGVVVYELLAGEKPFAAENLPALFYLICKQDPKPIEQANTTVTETVGKVLQRALAKEPSQRFASCGDFIGALSMALADCPDWVVLSKTASLPEQGSFDETAADVAAYQGAQQITRSVGESGATLRRSEDGAVSGGGAAAVKNGPMIPPPDVRNYDLPSITRRRRGEGEDGTEPAPERSSFAKRLGLILAMCFAIAAAIVFIVKWNTGSALPVQVADPNLGPATPPPSGDVVEERSKDSVQHIAPPTHTQTAENRPAEIANRSPQRTPEASGASAAPANLRAVGNSEIQLVSEPAGAKVVVDNKPETSCNAPCTLTLANGRHTLAAEMAGYNLAHRIFTIPGDDSLFVSLSKSVGVLLVTSSPSGCTVVVDGKEYGQTPTTLHLTSGPHRVALLNGSSEHQETIEVQTDGFEVRRFPCQ